MPSLRRTRRDMTPVPPTSTTDGTTPGAATGPARSDVDALRGPRRSPLEAVLAKAVTIPSAKIHEHVETLRRRNPGATPGQILTQLEREYLNVVSATGGAVGATAAAPAVGTSVAVGLTAADVAAFFTASAAFSLAVASVHGIEVQDAERRRALLLTTVLGEEGAKELEEAIKTGSGAAATTLLTRLPTSTISSVNSTLTRRLLRRQAARHGALAFGRLAPFGIGVWIGVKGARSLGRTVIEGAQATFGPPPTAWPRVVEVVETGGVPRLVDQQSGTAPGSV
jgi:hypothetical protein